MPEQRIWDFKVVNLIRAVDGDTYDLTLEKEMIFGFYLSEKKQWSSRFRLLGCDTWEMNEAGGAAARRYAEGWIQAGITADVLRGQTFKTDNFGRWLIDLYRTDDLITLSTELISLGHAVPYPKK